jgi:hypothetical protein
MRPNILRFTAFCAGYYCENILLCVAAAGSETDARAPAIHRAPSWQGHVRPGAQTEMPNRTSFSEVPAASMPAFGDSGVIENVKIGRTNRSIGQSP